MGAVKKHQRNVIFIAMTRQGKLIASRILPSLRSHEVREATHTQPQDDFLAFEVDYRRIAPLFGNENCIFTFFAYSRNSF